MSGRRTRTGLGQRLRARVRWHLGLGSVLERLGAAEQELAAVRARSELAVERARHFEELAATTAGVALMPPSDTLISVVMPTRNRARLLPEAIATVLAQGHAHWELLVIDDVSEDDTQAVLAGYDDPRIRVLRSDGGPGASIARNAALEHARGEVVAYLDDDNLMAPGWLRAVAKAFDEDPGLQLAYGARVREDEDGRVGIEVVPWNSELLRRHNFMDQNVIAHRRGLSGVRYDPALDFASDWDVALRLTRTITPLSIPALAVVYRIDTPGRLSDNHEARAGWREVVRRALSDDPA